MYVIAVILQCVVTINVWYNTPVNLKGHSKSLAGKNLLKIPLARRARLKEHGVAGIR